MAGWHHWMWWITGSHQWMWVSVNSWSWWWTGRPGMLQFIGLQRVGHDWATDLIWSDILFSALFVKEAILCPYIFLAPLTKIVALLLSHVRLFVTPWTAAHQASLSFTISQSLLKFTFTESVMLFNHLILCCPPLLTSIFLSFKVFPDESALCLHQVAKVLKLQLQHQSFQWIFRVDFL